ncbi:MAG TPA: AGE family epimerase/isomerase, partial [Parvularculaceae bacterium]|nr:AGE family epimerase/isomerase [Parvularculaceae bacterium]
MMGALAEKIAHWTFEEALPVWAERGLDREGGGYVEGFDESGGVPIVEEKRLRVVARQIYVFSHAAILGFAEGERCARHGYDFLRAVFDRSGGAWPRLLTRDGAAIDATPDLYDHAFVLFALAWFYRMTGDKTALDLVDKTLAAIEAR